MKGSATSKLPFVLLFMIVAGIAAATVIENHFGTDYAHQHKLYKLPNVIHVFFRYEPDNEIERINTDMEHTIEDLTNTKDRMILSLLNKYPIVSVKSHTRPFEKQWLNVVAGLLIPINVFIYIRMWFFRLRLLRDLKTIKETNTEIINRIHQMQ